MTLFAKCGIICHIEVLCSILQISATGTVDYLDLLRQEFNELVDSLLYRKVVSYDVLCRMAENHLKGLVIRWCKSDEALCGRGYEDDVMQEIQLRLIQKTVTYFLLKDGPDNPVNDDPEGFRKWMIVLAKNVVKSYSNRVRSTDFNTTKIDDSDISTEPDYSYEDEQDRIDRLKEAFNIVVSADAGVYKVLTWLAQIIFIIEYDVSKIKSAEIIVKEFSDKTLYEMYDMVMKASEKTKWLEFSEKQRKRIQNELKKTRDNGILYGETKYSDFFMKSSGKTSGKKSVSDWTSRMNAMIRRKLSVSDNI